MLGSPEASDTIKYGRGDLALSLFPLPNSNEPFIIHAHPGATENQTVLCVVIVSWIPDRRLKGTRHWIIT